jgi:hypothetical protein
MNIDISVLDNEVKNKFGIFISHSRNRSSNFENVLRRFHSEGIPCCSDSNLIPGDSNYIRELENMILNVSSGVIILDEDALNSPWIMYEIGLLEGSGKKVLIYDPDNGMKDVKKPAFLHKYKPFITSIETLVKEASNFAMFGNVFEHEIEGIITISQFNKIFDTNTKIIKIDIGLNNIADIEIPNLFKFGLILLRMSKYEVDKEREALFQEEIERNDESIKYSEAKIKSDRCLKYGNENAIHCYANRNISCAIRSDPPTDSIETVILNKILFNTFIDIANSKVTYLVPIHIKYGVTFKCFVDIKSTALKNKIVEILHISGMKDIGVSDSSDGHRVYFLLPSCPTEGIFLLSAPDKGIINNYICPGVF